MSNTTPARHILMFAAQVLLAVSIPFGIVMAIYMDNGWWLLFCIPIFVFLS